jgi:nucleotide-binding universal stress UspA family protein
MSTAEVDEMVEEKERQRGDWLTELVQQSCAALGREASDYLKPELHLVKGDARNVVPECATALGAELVAMGTVGRTGIPGFIIGNTAEEILNRIDCSVLAIKPAGFASPVTADVGG